MARSLWVVELRGVVLHAREDSRDAGVLLASSPGPGGRVGGRTELSEVELHPLVRGGEAQALVETLRLGTPLVGRELNHHAAALARAGDRPLQECLAQT